MEKDFGLDQNTTDKLNNIMYPQKGYIEITQDAAAFLMSDGDFDGVFTKGIQSCIVWVFKYNNGSLIIHDSGQLELFSMRKLIQSFGVINDVEVHHGPSFYQMEYYPTLDKRIKQLCTKLKCNIPQFISNKNDTFGLMYSHDGQFEHYLHSESPQRLIAPDDIDMRDIIIKFNNNFIEQCSQTLKVDLQFDGKTYLYNTKPIHSADSVLKDLKNQKGFFWHNLCFLGPVVVNEIISFPIWFQSFVTNYIDHAGRVLTRDPYVIDKAYSEFCYLKDKNS